MTFGKSICITILTFGSLFAKAQAIQPAEVASCFRCEAIGENGQQGNYMSSVAALAQKGALLACENEGGVACKVTHCFREEPQLCGAGAPKAMFRCEAVGIARDRKPIYTEDTDNSSAMAAKMAVVKCEHAGGMDCRVTHCYRQ